MAVYRSIAAQLSVKCSRCQIIYRAPRITLWPHILCLSDQALFEQTLGAHSATSPSIAGSSTKERSNCVSSQRRQPDRA